MEHTVLNQLIRQCRSISSDGCGAYGKGKGRHATLIWQLRKNVLLVQVLGFLDLEEPN
jgi:hypothetical protein